MKRPSGNWLLRLALPAVLVSVVLAPLVADRYEKQLTRPTAQIMTFLLTGTFAEHTFEDGVPRVYYRRLGETHANPVYAAVYAFWYYQQWRDSDEFDYFLAYYNVAPPDAPAEGYRKYFFNVADWFVENMAVREYGDQLYGVWEYDFPWEIYRLEPGWVSGMAQGLALQVLVRAWLENNDARYLEAIDLALTSFEVPINAGGVTIMDSTDAWWYEEYASPDAVESRVFNGAAHSVIALFEVYRVLGNDYAFDLAQRGLASIVDALPAYDASWWTYYDALGLMSNYKYHHVNINLARHLAQQTSNEELLAAAVHWESYRTPFFEREFIKQRPQFADIGLLLLAWGITFMCLLFLISVFVLARRTLGGRNSSDQKGFTL